jgi:ribosomal protein L37AE/L43A
MRRIHRKRRKERAKERRRIQLSLARPRCPECSAILAKDDTIADIWRCEPCQTTLLRLGSTWLTQLEEPAAFGLWAPPAGHTRKAA